MPSNLSQTGGLSGVPLDDLGAGPVNASRPRTFAPPTGVNTGTPGRPRTAQGGAGGGGSGTIPAPPQIAALTNPQQFQPGQQQQQQGQPQMLQAPLGNVAPIMPSPGQLVFDPFSGNWILPDGTVRPGVTGGI